MELNDLPFPSRIYEFSIARESPYSSCKINACSFDGENHSGKKLTERNSWEIYENASVERSSPGIYGNVSIIDEDIERLARLFHEKSMKNRGLRGLREYYLGKRVRKGENKFYKNLLKIKSYYKWKEIFVIKLLRNAKSRQIKKLQREGKSTAGLEIIRETEHEYNLESGRYSFA